MMRLLIRVKKIDHNGFNGRDHHPLAAHEGMEGVVTDIHMVADEDMETPYDLAPYYTPRAMQVFCAVMADGAPVELMGHEIELVSATHNGDL